MNTSPKVRRGLLRWYKFRNHLKNEKCAHVIYNLVGECESKPAPVAAQSKVWVCRLSPAEIVG